MEPAPSSLPPEAQHLHTARIAVRWGDMDAVGHVNNSRFFTYFEEARVQWLKDTLDAPRGGRHGPVLAAASCDFQRPVHHPATLRIDVYAEPPGRTSLTTHYRARPVEAPSPVATGTAVLVWVEVETGAPVPLPNLGLD